jgi:hypothetical protein
MAVEDLAAPHHIGRESAALGKLQSETRHGFFDLEKLRRACLMKTGDDDEVDFGKPPYCVTRRGAAPTCICFIL